MKKGQMPVKEGGVAMSIRKSTIFRQKRKREELCPEKT